MNTCSNCGEKLDPLNEDEKVSGICMACVTYDESWEVDKYGDTLYQNENCNCEDYPCCGH